MSTKFDIEAFKTARTDVVPDTLLERDREVWRLRTEEFKTYKEIAEAFGVTPQTVAAWLARIRADAKASLDQYVQDKIAEQVAQLEAIVVQSMRAWEASKSPRHSRKTRRIRNADDNPAGALTDADVAEVIDTDEAQVGDPRFLAAATHALSQIQRLLGLNAPTHIKVSEAPPVLTQEDATAQIAQLLAAARERQLQAGPARPRVSRLPPNPFTDPTYGDPDPSPPDASPTPDA